MGLSSSQARLLSLTARMHDIEYKAARVEAQKLQMANKSARVYEEYLQALDATKIQYSALACDGSTTYLDVTLNAMENGVISDYVGETSSEILFLQTQDGAIIVTPAVAEKYGLVDGQDLGTMDEYLDGLGFEKSTRDVYSEREVEDTDTIVGFTQIANEEISQPISNTTYTYNPVENLGGSINYGALSGYASFDSTHSTNTDNYTTLSEATSVSGSTLEEGSTYAISSAEDLVKLAELVNSGVSTSGVTFVLSNDIDMTGVDWEGIGTSSTNAFEGTFDGNGYTISNLTGSQGLFGYTNGATIQNVGLENVNIDSTGNYIGALVGYATDTNVENCYSTGSVKSTGNYVGGLIGNTKVNSGKTITYSNIYSSATVTGNTYVGGLLGYTRAYPGDTIFDIENCYAIGNVTGNNYVGGFAGYMYYDEDNADDTTDIRNCYAGGNVTGTSYVGGFVGYFKYLGDGGDTCEIEGCISAGKVNGSDSTKTGAFAGTIVINSYDATDDSLLVKFTDCGYTENSGASSAYGSILDNSDNDVTELVTNSGSASDLVEYECVGTIPSISEEDYTGDYMQNIIAVLTKAGVYSSDMDADIQAFLSKFEDTKEDNAKLWYLNEAIVEYLNDTGSEGLGEALAQDILNGTTTATAEYQDGEELDGSILRGVDTIESAVVTETESTKGEVTIPSVSNIATQLYYALKQAGYSIEESDVTTWINSNYSTSNDEDKVYLANINDSIQSSSNLEDIYNAITGGTKYEDDTLYNTEEWNITVSSENQTIIPEYGTTTETYLSGQEEYWDTTNSEITNAMAIWTIAQKGFIVATEEQAASSTWITNMIQTGVAVFTTFDLTQLDTLAGYSLDEITNMSEAEYNELLGIKNTSVATNTSLREVSDEINLKKAEAKYEADMKKIDLKDRKYDTDLAAIENEREAIKDEIDTLKTVAKDNIERTFKLFA